MFRHRFILKEEDVSASMAADTSIVEVSGIGVFCKDHVTRTVGDAIVWVCGNIVEELVDSVSGGLSGRSLLGANDAESNEKFVVDHESVPKEVANDTLDAFYAIRIEWRARIGCCRLLGLGAIGDGGMIVRR